MHIKRISVEGWRGLTCELGDLAPGLNLICGPNESGKSRLVQALRFALFESSSGRARHKKALETWGTADGRPRVEVEFELAGANWLVTKTYLGTGSGTVLRGAGKTLEGEEAEARLADLMGVSQSGTTEMKRSERGIWSLLWVDQGDSREPPLHNEIARGRIHDQLTAEIGEIAAGEAGQRILQRAREHKELFYTARTEGEKPVLRDAREKVKLALAKFDAAAEQHQAIAHNADQLSQLREREADLKARIAAASTEQAATEAQHRRAAEAAMQLERCRHQLELGRLELEKREQAWLEWSELSAQISSLAEDTRALELDQAGAATARQAAEGAYVDLTRAVAEADARLADAATELQRLRQRQKVGVQRAEQNRLRIRLNDAAALGGRIGEIRTELARLAQVTLAEVDTLRRAGQAADAARARLEGASASVEFRAHRSLAIDGTTLAPGASLTVLIEDEKHLEIDGVLSLVIRPGGGELALLRDALADADAALAAKLADLGVGSITEADSIALARRDLEAELERQRKALASLLPEGREEIEARINDIETQLDAAGPDANHPFDAGALEQAETRERALTAERDAVRARRDDKARDLTLAREAERDLEIQLQQKRQQHAALSVRVTALPDETVLAEALAAARRIWSERVAARDLAEATYRELGGEDLDLQLEQTNRALGQLRGEFQAAQEACIRIEGRLESAGTDARYERVLEFESELVTATAELERLEREAHAARRLFQVLNQEYRGARERLTLPVIDRIRPYLADLFPGSEVWLDDEMNLLGMRNDRADAAFEALSGGAREQLSLLVRIGLAEVLGASEPWPLVLDDVLVNTDAERIRRVQRLLFRAARKLQILLFTCHGPLFDMLGPDRRIDLRGSDLGGSVLGGSVVAGSDLAGSDLQIARIRQ
jgi:energy-coupling factor transporter ATP-binding protein EcfA2